MPVAQDVIKQQLAACRQFSQFFTRKEINYLPQIIREGETIHAVISGLHEGTTWLLAATDQRVLFLDKGIITGLKQIEMPLTEVQTIQHKTGWVFGEIVITTAGGARRVEQLDKAGTNRFAEILSEQLRRVRTGPPAQSSKGDDVVDKLERLAALRSSGVLTAEEFEKQKARLLQ